MILTSTVKWATCNNSGVCLYQDVCVFVVMVRESWGGGGAILLFHLIFHQFVYLFIDRPLSYQLHSVGLSVSTFPSMYTSMELVVIWFGRAYKWYNIFCRTETGSERNATHGNVCRVFVKVNSIAGRNSGRNESKPPNNAITWGHTRSSIQVK